MYGTSNEEFNCRAEKMKDTKKLIFITAMLTGLLSGIMYAWFPHNLCETEPLNLNINVVNTIVQETKDMVPEIEIIKLVVDFKYKPVIAHYQYDLDDLKIIAKTVWGEARGCSLTEQAAVVWCILNRVDSPDFPDNIADVVLQKNQFSGYNASNPVNTDILNLVQDVCMRWRYEGTGILGSLGRVLPKEYCWFKGDGTKNIFRDKYKGGNIWDWTLYSPYNL